MNAAQWDKMWLANKSQLLMDCGWRTNKGGISIIGRRLMNTAWDNIPPNTQQIMCNHYKEATVYKTS